MPDRELDGKTTNNAKPGNARPESGGQALMAAAVGATVLAVTMVLILVAATHGRKPVPVVATDTGGRNASPQAYGRYILVDHYAAGTETTAIGSLAFTIKGHARNTGLQTVAAADLRCYFPMRSGGETHIDFPLVADTRLDDLGEGPLPATSGRDFTIRLGRVPEDISPELIRVEVVNIRIKGPLIYLGQLRNIMKWS